MRNTRAGSPGFANSTTNADAGDVIEYRITVTNIGNGSAHKIKLTDDANTLGYYGSSCTAPLVDVTSTGSLFAGTLVFTNPLTGNGDATVNPGEQAIITYQCTIQPTAVPNAQNSLDNTAAVTEYFSTATSTANLAPAGFGILSDKATVGIQEIQSLTKAITDSSVSGSTPNNNINNGETLTFLITATLSEGTYAGFALTDNTIAIPSPITCGSNRFTCTNVSVDGAGTATVAATNGSTPGVITYAYTQAKTASGNNTATVSANNATSRTASATWTVDDPNPVITKTFNPAGGVSAGDTVQVQLGWSNTDSDNPMFRCVISDVLDANVFDATPVTAVTTPAGYTFNYDAGTRTVTYTATNLENPCPTVNAGDAKFSARIKNNVVTGNYTNTAAIATQTLPASQPGGKAVSANVTTPVPISTPTVSGKTITATSLADTSGANVAIGEIVTYQIVFRMAEGNTNSVTLIDQIAAGTTPLQLVYIPGTATLARNSTALSAATDPGGINSATAGVAVTAPITVSGQDIAVNLGNVVNNDANAASQETYTLTLQFRVGNVAANTGGRQLQNRSRLSYTPFGSGTAQFVNGPSATVRVVVPQVAVSKVVTPAAGAAGNTATYTLTVRNSATGANAAPAYDYAFSDILPTDITPTGTPTANVGTTSAVVSSLAFNGQTLSGVIDKLDPGEAITITYTGQISLTTPFGRMLVNSANASATSLPGSDANERTGSGSGPNNLFAGTSATVTTQTVTMTKALKNPQTFYAIGEEVEYELRLALPVGSATGMNVLDTLPSGLTYVSSSAAITIVGGVTAPTAGLITPTATSPLTFALGAVAANLAGEVVISYRAKVDNLIANQDGAVRTNNARVSYDNPNPNGVSPLIYIAPNPPSIRV
ncbi:MAG: isopeptide-forming domain-containing fimbrial protein, partial [Candidatus Contendobacter sp.]|nr:isopeptide-forming domain-containing fimbrial protein [Candidatus Contendobacter sp.]